MPTRSIQTTAASAAATLEWIPLEVHSRPAQTQWAVNKTGNGTFAADVEFTLDNVLRPGVSAVSYVEALVSVSSQTGTMDHPATAIRLAITSASGHNNVTFRVVQAGP